MKPTLLFVSAFLFLTSELVADFPLPPSRTGHLYVSSYGSDAVFVFTPEGQPVTSFSAPSLNGPRGLAFNRRGELYCSSQLSDELIVFTPSGRYLRTLSFPGQLDGPTAAAIAPSGEIYISSYDNDRIVVLSAEEEFQREINIIGLNGPNCIAFEPDGSFYLASQLTNTIFWVSAGGDSTVEFSGGGILSPMGIAVRPGLGEFLVTGGSSRNLVRFQPAGETFAAHEEQIRDPLLSGPQGVAIDDRGYIYTGSFFTSDVLSFFADGSLINVFTADGLSRARSVAFLPLDRPRPFRRGDLDGSGQVVLPDVIRLLLHLFRKESLLDCEATADVDGSGTLALPDVIFLLLFLFRNGPEPAEPFGEPGEDPDSPLPCVYYRGL